MPLYFEHDTLILDASCIINLYASGEIEGILRAIPSSVTVAAYVYKIEALWIYSNPYQGGNKEREPVRLRPLVEAGLLTVVDLATEEEAELLATLAARIRGQGEVITGAIAIRRNWAIAIDDSKARRLFYAVSPHLQLIYTLDLVKHWAELNSLPSTVIGRTLQSIRYCGSYFPSKSHPLYDWWHDHNDG